MEIKVIKNIKDFENLNENWTDTLNNQNTKLFFKVMKLIILLLTFY